MVQQNNIDGSVAGVGISTTTAVLGLVKIAIIVEICGRYLPLFQTIACFVAIVTGCIVMIKEIRNFFKS